MDGMCVFCRYNVAAPGEDLCRDCLDLRAEKRRAMLWAVPSCQFGHPACSELHQCADCAEFASYPRGAA